MLCTEVPQFRTHLLCCIIFLLFLLTYIKSADCTREFCELAASCSSEGLSKPAVFEADKKNESINQAIPYSNAFKSSILSQQQLISIKKKKKRERKVLILKQDVKKRICDFFFFFYFCKSSLFFRTVSNLSAHFKSSVAAGCTLQIFYFP